MAFALARFGSRTAWVGGLVDTALGRMVANHARAQGVDVSHAPVVAYDGVGRSARMGLHFTEVGTGPRASTSLYDRGHSATAAIRPGDIDWRYLFEELGVRWFHTGGVFTCLSEQSREVAAEAIAAAQAAGTVVSYDLNYRSNLWDSASAVAATTPLLSGIDVLIGNEEDLQQALGYRRESVEDLSSLDLDVYRDLVRSVARDHPNLTIVATTLREVINADENNWSALLYSVPEDRFHTGPNMERLRVEDRIGGGDGFVSGLVYALLRGEDPGRAVAVGTAHGALVQTTRGDTTGATLPELLRVVQGGSARIQR